MDLKYEGNVLLRNIQYANDTSTCLLGINDSEGSLEKIQVKTASGGGGGGFRNWHIYVFDLAQFLADGHDSYAEITDTDIGTYLYPESNAISINELYDLNAEELARYRLDMVLKILGPDDVIYPAWYCPIESSNMNWYESAVTDYTWSQFQDFNSDDSNRMFIYRFYAINLAAMADMEDSNYGPSLQIILGNDGNTKILAVQPCTIFQEGGIE